MSIVIEQLRYVVLGTRDLEAAARFAGAELGLQALPPGTGEQAFRSDERQYSLVYSSAAPRRHAVGLELRDEAALLLARTHPEGLTAPPPMAIAHHLIRAFVEGKDPPRG